MTTMQERSTVEQIKEFAKRKIWVRFQKEGIHCFPDALTDPKLQDVSFLGHPHRHIFHFRVWIDVFHNDRDIEFIQFKRWLENLYENGTIQLNHKSCEMIADELYVVIAGKYPGRAVDIEVSEDGENGCTINYGYKHSVPPNKQRTIQGEV